MTAVAPTAAEVRCRSFNRAKIIEALQLFGAPAHGRTGAKALEVIESGAPVANSLVIENSSSGA